MVASLDSRPQVVDLFIYGGDTYTLTVEDVPAQVTAASPDWSAQIRPAGDAAAVDAEFQITPPAVAGGPAYLMLDAETTALLVQGAPVITRRAGRAVTQVAQYQGVYDCQLSNAGADPVRTLFRGTITIEMDVTRLLP